MRKGFTLSEVLITLGIVGVVSAMTLPTLLKKHQRQVFVTQLRKVCTEVTQAFEQVITDSNAVSLRESGFGRRGVESFVRTYFKTTKVCTNNPGDCFADQYKNINGVALRNRTLFGEAKEGVVAAVLSNGASLWLRGMNQGCEIYIDVNGKQGPNILARDLFDIYIDND